MLLFWNSELLNLIKKGLFNACYFIRRYQRIFWQIISLDFETWFWKFRYSFKIQLNFFFSSFFKFMKMIEFLDHLSPDIKSLLHCAIVWRLSKVLVQCLVKLNIICQRKNKIIYVCIYMLFAFFIVRIKYNSLNNLKFKKKTWES